MLANAANKLSENENYLAEYLLHLVNIILTSKGIYFGPVMQQNLLTSSVFWACGWIQDPTG